MEQLHTDVCRPFPITTKTSKHYFISIINNTTHFTVIITIHKKSNIKAMLHSHLAATPADLKCQHLHSDQGGKYTSEQVQELLCTTSIIHKATSSHTPEHNGIAKQFNRTIVEMVQCMLHNSGLAQCYWGEALHTTTAIYNHLPTNANNGASPLDQWDANHAGALKDMHQFRAKVEVLVLPSKRTKLSVHTHTGVYLRPADSGTSNHQVLVQGHILMTCKVVFPYNTHDMLMGDDMSIAVAPAIVNPLAKEANVGSALQWASIDQSTTLAPSVLGASGSAETSPPHSPSQVELSIIEWTPQGELPMQVKPPDPLTPPDMPVMDDDPTLKESEEEEHAAPPSLEANDIVVAVKKKWPMPKKPPAHKRKKNTKFYNDDFCAFTAEVLQALDVSDSACTPNSYNEAVALPEAAEWIKAMKAKYGTLDCNGMFELALLPVGL
ncbi:integrase core domain containing protein [Acanthamoeba castellanii str. Neff]|uniref:Integrase core domain containing protein n=1 Tax=Acanthamoeba castellanii (strain ATCC 30010 / Neff) TaxID=1257118 RepID=L8HEQ5_ACACF|nr:integrase core domain containing protein [Acanthamoeba castellanii str. Neff]ELR23717.1 integrase core domain containing protein [Acanthamoeba castellanii str. Neff]